MAFPPPVDKTSGTAIVALLYLGLNLVLIYSTRLEDMKGVIAVGSLALWACLTFFLSAQLFRWEPESKIPRRAKLLVAATALPFVLLGIWENSTSRTVSKAKAMSESLNGPARADSAPRAEH